MLAVDPHNQTFGSIVTANHLLGESNGPAISPISIMHEGDKLAFDNVAVASPDPGGRSDGGDADARSLRDLLQSGSDGSFQDGLVPDSFLGRDPLGLFEVRNG